MMLTQGSYRAEKVQYSDGVGCTVWEPFDQEPGNDGMGMGMCFDFPFDDLEDLITLLTALRDAPVETLEEEL